MTGASRRDTDPTNTLDSRETTLVPVGSGWKAEEADPDLLEAYRRFLEEEAIPAGGIGPEEADRLTDRHLHDSLGFAVAWQGEPPPERLLDIGSGVGLPGIPLAILWPDCRVSLIERSGRRARLLRRALHILQLRNTNVIEAEYVSLPPEPTAGVVMRAVIPPREAPTRLMHLGAERLVVASGGDDVADWGERRAFRVFARTGWVRTMRRQ